MKNERKMKKKQQQTHTLHTYTYSHTEISHNPYGRSVGRMCCVVCTAAHRELESKMGPMEHRTRREAISNAKKKRKKIIETNEYDRHTLLMSNTVAFSLSRTVNQARRASVFFMFSDKIHKTVVVRGVVPYICRSRVTRYYILVSLFCSFR